MGWAKQYLAKLWSHFSTHPLMRCHTQMCTVPTRSLLQAPERTKRMKGRIAQNNFTNYRRKMECIVRCDWSQLTGQITHIPLSAVISDMSVDKNPARANVPMIKQKPRFTHSTVSTTSRYFGPRSDFFVCAFTGESTLRHVHNLIQLGFGWQLRFMIDIQNFKNLYSPNSLPSRPLRHVAWTGFMYGASALKQYFVLHLNGSKHCLMCTFKAIHVLGILDPSTSLIISLHFCRWFWNTVFAWCYSITFGVEFQLPVEYSKVCMLGFHFQ